MTPHKSPDLDVPVHGGGEAAPSEPADPTEAFSQLLGRIRKDVNARLAGYLDSRWSDMSRHGPDVQAMVGAVRDLTMRGGKRLRPALLYVGYRATDDGLPEEPALDAGASLELLQTYLLIHDDWMDGDDTRRGAPSVPAMLREHFGSREIGDASAILAGDLASAMALDMLSRVEAPPKRVMRALTLFAEIQQDVVCGQQLDVAGHEPEVEAYYTLKTGSYTIRGPLVLGAVLADASPELIGTLKRYAEPLGIAFQMQDDLLGVFGDPALTGKPVGEDLRRGRHTSVVLQARAMLQGDLRRFCEAVVGNANASSDDVRDLTRMLEATGVRKAVSDRVEVLILDATRALADSPINAQGKAWLLGAASLIASRLD